MNPTPQRGFGLLEAIVAIALLGSAGLALFSWVQNSVQTATRLQHAEQRLALQLEGQAWLRHLNPAARASGDEEIGDGLRIRWQSELVEPLRDEDAMGGALQPSWRVGLYRLSVEVAKEGQSAQWQQLQTGWLARGRSSP